VTERHPKKEIQSAIEYAVEHGWHFTKAGPRAHIYEHYTARTKVAMVAVSESFPRHVVPATMPVTFAAASTAVCMPPVRR
jgi:hypothetical protein